MLSINMPLEGERFMTYHDFGCIDEFEPHNAQMILTYRGNLYTNSGYDTNRVGYRVGT